MCKSNLKIIVIRNIWAYQFEKNQKKQEIYYNLLQQKEWTTCDTTEPCKNKDRSFVSGVQVLGFNLICVSNNLVFTKQLVMDG